MSNEHAEEAPQPKRKARVFTEEVKQRQVSHWDWDYLSSDDLERLLNEQDPPAGGDPAAS